MGMLLKGRSPPASPLPEMAPRRPWAAFLLVCFLAGAGMVVTSLLVALNERQSTLEKVKASNLVSAQLIAERLAALFRDSEAISGHLAATSPLISKAERGEAREEAKDVTSRFSELSYAILTDRNGDMLWNTENYQVGTINYADRDYFKAHQAGAEFLIGDPIVGRISGRSVIPVTRAVHEADGGFGGVLFIGVKTAVIEDLLGNFRHHPGVTSTLWRNDGTMLIRYPQAPVGQRFPNAPLFQHLAVAPSGTYVAPSVIDGDDRISSYTIVANTSLVINVGESMDDALAEWRVHLAMIVGLNVLVLGTLLFLARRNITQTNALQHSSERNRLLLRHASDGVHIIDKKGTLIEASDSFGEMLGYAREELIGQTVAAWDANFPPAELEEVVAQQFEKVEVSTFKTRHRHKNGSIIDVEVTGLRIDLDGRSVLYNSSRNITDRLLQEREVGLARDWLGNIIDSLPQHIAALDAEGRISLVNKAWREFSNANGGPEDFCMGSHYGAVCHNSDEQPCDPALTSEAIQNIIDGTSEGI